ncbi:MAG TPA: capsule biosynthesis protein CapD [Elusimicrobia bacterium]|nr:MAG: capsule biosynthesis protein CapD [Elusimicrobia bacterium GWA2_66_18]OGR73647.1 MAG: capsule biosynthesis protein CapD [Elusimicrobia bacterium GWC2_65_9]HAZ07733.1 capsule biosynthesis protein CapD [Elusimicrobiota bacterium]
MQRTVLVTGGTGFLGKRLGLALKKDFNVVLSGRNNKQNMIAAEFSGCRALPLDVANIESVRDVFAEARPHIVVHAAATKFVDLAEKHPMECIDVNVVGSQNVARVAVEKGAEVVVGVSTDKAAPPIRNIYGLSKAVMEKMFCSMNGKTPTRFCCVRYGNVAWSTGSVLPIWKKMHERTGVIKTTGPEMRRFFFTVDEAVKLVRTAIDNIDAISGNILTRTMKSAQIEALLKVWIKHKGGSWEKIAGRPGDRLDEFIFGEAELPFTSECKYGDVPHYAISPNTRIERPLKECVSSANVERLSEQEILAIINDPPLEEK